MAFALFVTDICSAAAGILVIVIRKTSLNIGGTNSSTISSDSDCSKCNINYHNPNILIKNVNGEYATDGNSMVNGNNDIIITFAKENMF